MENSLGGTLSAEVHSGCRRHRMLCGITSWHRVASKECGTNEIIFVMWRFRMFSLLFFLAQAVYLKPWYCFYIQLHDQRLRGKNGAKDINLCANTVPLAKRVRLEKENFVCGIVYTGIQDCTISFFREAHCTYVCYVREGYLARRDKLLADPLIPT